MFKEYDSSTYKEKKIKDRTPFSNDFKRLWNSAKFWRCIVLLIFIVIVGFCSSCMQVSAAESEISIDESYIQSNFSDYGYRVIVCKESTNYFILLSDTPIVFKAYGYGYFAVSGATKVGYCPMTIDSNNSIAIMEGSSGTYVDNNTSDGYCFNPLVNLSNTEIIYSNHDIYSFDDSTGLYTAGTDLIFAKSILSEDVTDSDNTDENIIVSIDLTEVLTFCDKILLVLQGIFSLNTIILFFLIAEWTTEKIKNMIRRFSRNE